MDREPPPKKIRKGAKSCTECRRRKIRCVWISDDAHVCRRCEERGSACVPQVFSSQTTRSGETLGSRERIGRLEQQVRSLTQVVNTIQDKHGGPLVVDEVSQDAVTDDVESDAESEDIESMGGHPPAYLATLFNNDVISSGNKFRDEDDLREFYSKLLEDKARTNLQKLIPPREDVEIIASFATNWLALYQGLFPSTNVAQTEADLVANYDDVKTSTIDATLLATWLVTIAITIQQIPNENMPVLPGIKNLSHYCRAVSDAVETNIIAHDSLMGTMNGIGAALHFLRLLAGRENFKRIWLILRRVIAISELIGMPRAAKAAQNSQFRTLATQHGPDYDMIQQKAETWISICSLDRILGMMCNLPMGTTKYALPQLDLDPTDIKVFMRSYLRNLADLASKIHDLDDLRLSGGSDEQICTEVLKVDRELFTLASTAPKSWWSEDDPTELPKQIIPYWHYYVTLRTHLVLTLQRDDNHRYDYSRFTCMNACQQALQRYLKMRPTLTGAFFLGRMLDLQALTAVVILLLSYHGTKSDSGVHLQTQNINEPSDLIMQVVAIMEKGGKKQGSDFSRHAAPTIRSLKLLLEDDGHFQAKDMSLKVPLLGKIHVKKTRTSTNSRPQPDVTPFHSPATASSLRTYEGNSSQFVSPGSSNQFPPGNDWNFDPFTWFIEDDREAMFKDANFAEDFSSFESPINSDYFNFNS